MISTIIYLGISLLVSLTFILLGISQYRAKTPVTINTGEIPPREDELTSVEKWNHQHGKNLILFGCMLFITLSVFVYFLERMDHIVFQMIIFMVVLFGEVAWVELEHNKMKKKMIKTK